MYAIQITPKWAENQLLIFMLKVYRGNLPCTQDTFSMWLDSIYRSMVFIIKLRHHKWDHSTVAIWDFVAIWYQCQVWYIATLEEGCNDNGNVFYVRSNFDIHSKSRLFNHNKWEQSQIAATQ